MSRYSSWKAYFNSFPLRTRLVFAAMFFYLIFFTLISYFSGNNEFFFYAIVFFCFFVFIVSYYHKLRMTNWLLGGIAVHWLLHFLGGFVYFGSTRLYDLWLISHVFKYDNLVHTFGMFLGTFIIYNLLRPHFKLPNRTALFHFSVLLVLVVMGVGATAEIGELIAVLFFHAAQTVGGYFNNAFDLVWNFTGGTLACLVISRYELRQMRWHTKR